MSRREMLPERKLTLPEYRQLSGHFHACLECSHTSGGESSSPSVTTEEVRATSQINSDLRYFLANTDPFSNFMDLTFQECQKKKKKRTHTAVIFLSLILRQAGLALTKICLYLPTKCCG